MVLTLYRTAYSVSCPSTTLKSPFPPLPRPFVVPVYSSVSYLSFLCSCVSWCSLLPTILEIELGDITVACFVLSLPWSKKEINLNSDPTVSS